MFDKKFKFKSTSAIELQIEQIKAGFWEACHARPAVIESEEQNNSANQIDIGLSNFEGLGLMSPIQNQHPESPNPTTNLQGTLLINSSQLAS